MRGSFAHATRSAGSSLAARQPFGLGAMSLHLVLTEIVGAELFQEGLQRFIN